MTVSSRFATTATAWVERNTCDHNQEAHHEMGRIYVYIVYNLNGIELLSVRSIGTAPNAESSALQPLFLSLDIQVMSPIGRYVALVVFIIVSLVRYRERRLVLDHDVSARQISLHFILSFTHQEYGRATSLSSIKSKFSSTPHEYVPDKYYIPPDFNATKPLHVRRANATMVMLARNSDMENAVQSVRRIQDRFNHKFNYPWVFLNEEPFTDEFKTYVGLLDVFPPFFDVNTEAYPTSLKAKSNLA
jgi:hypothetical protein